MSNNSNGDSNRERRGPVNRRRFLKAGVGTAGLLTVAGCSGGGDGGGDGGDGGGSDGGDGDGDGGDGSGSTPTETEADTPTVAQDEIQTGGTLRYGGSDPVEGMDPHVHNTGAAGRMQWLLFETLVQKNEQQELVPHLAEEWEIVDDQTIRFSLREGVKFHDGNEFTSADARASFARSTSEGHEQAANSEFIESLETPDETTFVVNLTSPYSPLLTLSATRGFMIVPERFEDVDTLSDASELVGTGPFKLEDWEVKSSISLTAHDEYWGSDEAGNQYPYVDSLEKRLLDEESTRFNALRNDEVDFISSVPVNRFEDLDDMSGIEGQQAGLENIIYMCYNCADPPFDDPNVRMAINYTVDNVKVMQGATNGLGTVSGQPTWPGTFYHFDDIPDEGPYGPDLDKAKEFLDKSEHPNGFEADITVPQPFSMNVNAMKLVAAQANQLPGVNLNPSPVTVETWLDQVWQKGDFEAASWGYEALWYPYYAFFKMTHPDGIWTIGNWNEETGGEEYMNLVEEANTVYDPDERRELYHEAMQVHYDQPGQYLWLFWAPNLVGNQEYLNGPVGSPDGSNYWFWRNWLEK